MWWVPCTSSPWNQVEVCSLSKFWLVQYVLHEGCTQQRPRIHPVSQTTAWWVRQRNSDSSRVTCNGFWICTSVPWPLPFSNPNPTQRSWNTSSSSLLLVSNRLHCRNSVKVDFNLISLIAGQNPANNNPFLDQQILQTVGSKGELQQLVNDDILPFVFCSVSVGKRLNSTKIQAKGLYKDAKVVRGRDWSYGDRDGGNGKQGCVVEVASLNNTPRAAVKVKWNSGMVDLYRVGHEGKVLYTVHVQLIESFHVVLSLFGV